MSVFAAINRVSRFGSGLIPKLSVNLYGRLLLDGKRDKEAELGNLARYGLNVQTEDAVLDEVQFPSEVPRIVFKDSTNFRQLLVAGLSILRIKRNRRPLEWRVPFCSCLPPGVIEVKPP